MLTLRIAIMALIWASALLAPAAAAPIDPGAANSAAAPIQRPRSEVFGDCRGAPSAEQTSYRYGAPEGPSSPGPTDPNGPST